MGTGPKPKRTAYIPPRNQRLDRELYAIVGNACFFTISAHGEATPFTSPELNDATIAVLLAERERMHMDLYAYCLMPDHLHMLVSPREQGFSMLTFVDQFKGKSTNVSWRHGWQGRLWQRRSYDHLIRSHEEMLAIAKYVLGNAVRAGLDETHEEYRWAGMPDPIPG
jgi:REP element-mobilizing transposase RayT